MKQYKVLNYLPTWTRLFCIKATDRNNACDKAISICDCRYKIEVTLAGSNEYKEVYADTNGYQINAGEN